MNAKALLSLVPLAALTLAACDSPTGGGSGTGDGGVSLAFGAQTSAAGSTAQDGTLTLAGDNGTLTITDLRVVVAEFEVDGEDDNTSCSGDDCEDFEAGPLFLDLPLGSAATVASGDLPAGTYREIEFEVEDLDDNEEDAAEAQRIQQLRQQILAQFPDWPQKASMLVVGSFQPANGAARPFRVFIEAEIEVETELVPPLVVSDASGAQQVSVTLDPASIFKLGNTVVDLSAFNGRLAEFDADKVERGFRGRSSGSSDD